MFDSILVRRRYVKQKKLVGLDQGMVPSISAETISALVTSLPPDSDGRKILQMIGTLLDCISVRLYHEPGGAGNAMRLRFAHSPSRHDGSEGPGAGAGAGPSSTVGIVLGDTPETKCLVVACMPGSPAYVSGKIKRGDVVQRVDGKQVDGSNVVYAIRGPDMPGTKVSLQLHRESKRRPIVVGLIRTSTEVLSRKTRLYDVVAQLAFAAGASPLDTEIQDIPTALLREIHDLLKWIDRERLEAEILMSGQVRETQEALVEAREDIAALIQHAVAALATTGGTPQGNDAAGASAWPAVDALASELKEKVRTCTRATLKRWSAGKAEQVARHDTKRIMAQADADMERMYATTLNRIQQGAESMNGRMSKACANMQLMVRRFRSVQRIAESSQQALVEELRSRIAEYEKSLSSGAAASSNGGLLKKELDAAAKERDKAQAESKQLMEQLRAARSECAVLKGDCEYLRKENTLLLDLRVENLKLKNSAESALKKKESVERELEVANHDLEMSRRNAKMLQQEVDSSKRECDSWKKRHEETLKRLSNIDQQRLQRTEELAMTAREAVRRAPVTELLAALDIHTQPSAEVIRLETALQACKEEVASLMTKVARLHDDMDKSEKRHVNEQGELMESCFREAQAQLGTSERAWADRIRALEHLLEDKEEKHAKLNEEKDGRIRRMEKLLNERGAIAQVQQELDARERKMVAAEIERDEARKERERSLRNLLDDR
jgi:hypothetical protein